MGCCVGLKTTISYLMLALMLNSCTSIYTKASKINHVIQYDTKEEYCEKVEKEYKMDTSKFVFISKNELFDFISHIQEENVVHYYGVVYDNGMVTNDSFKENFQQCTGIVSDHLSKAFTDETYKLKKSELNKFSFYRKDNSIFKFENKNEIVFVMSTQYGKQVINEIKKFIKKHEQDQSVYDNFDYRIISLD
jgi:hypothetical protein